VGSYYPPDRAPYPVKGDLAIAGDEMKGILTLSQGAIVRVRRQP